MNTQEPAKILVTGGCGFIGRHLTLRLRREGYPVRVLDSVSEQVHGPIYSTGWMDDAGIEFVKGSVCDSSTCAEATADIDTVIHLAAETGTGQSMYEIKRYVDTNVGGTAALLEACINRRIKKLLLSSSRAVYGEGTWRCPQCGPVHPSFGSLRGGASGNWAPACPVCGTLVTDLLPTLEEAPLDPVSVYGVSKLSQELLMLGLQRAYPVDVGVLRFFNVFGPGQSLNNPYTGVLAVFANRAQDGKPIDLYEDGEILRDFVFVEDVVEAILAAMRAPAIPICNVGSGRVVSIRYLAETIVSLVGSDSLLEVTHKGRVGDVRGLKADIRRAADSLQWTPKVPLEEGLRRFVEWALGQPHEDRYEESLSELKQRGLYA